MATSDSAIPSNADVTLRRAKSPSDFVLICIWIGAAIVALAPMMWYAKVSYDVLSGPVDDTLGLVLLGLLVSSVLGSLLLIAWAYVAITARNRAHVAGMIYVLTLVATIFVMIIRLVVPLLIEPEKFFEVHLAIAPGLFLIAIAGGAVMAILWRRSSARKNGMLSALSPLSIGLLIALSVWPRLTDPQIRSTPEEAWAAKTEHPWINAAISAAPIFQTTQLGDVVVLRWHVQPGCDDVMHLYYKRTLYGFGWDSSPRRSSYYVCEQPIIGFGGDENVIYAYGYFENGSSARITWKDGFVQETRMSEGYFLIVRENPFPDYWENIVKLRITDANGNMLYEETIRSDKWRSAP